ncbi:hypothetical protein [Burkholderia ubonensis]|uniref:hypothetical protein n=1 Tax=Burkholderia ubonensis TaxID=101571 RepID=UPI0012F8DAEE|nr:hypothetical protein [Burkholderia ubonensis]
MNIRISSGVSFAMIALSIVATNAFAHELPHDLVDQESTHPIVSPQYRQSVDSNRRDGADFGHHEAAPAPCIGPRSFCDIYGS